MSLLSWSQNARLRNFFADETGGEKDNINTLLILALLVLPIVFVIIKMGKSATDKTKNSWNNTTNADVPDASFD